MKDWIDQILQEKKIAYAVFDHDLALTKISPNFSQIMANRPVGATDSIWEIFPELFGSEDQVAAVLHHKKKRYEISKINQLAENGTLQYYNLTLIPSDAKSACLLCLISDTTSETSLEQKIIQQKHEIELLQASLVSYGNYSAWGILGESEPINTVRNFIGKIAPIRNTTILLQGESGTGKNLVARAIHQSSMEPKSPFVEINCTSIPPTLLESEIFGYEKGAFTNAVASKKGLLEEADGGTLFLDEIGELLLSVQVKFLSFLETKRFRRLGSTQERTVDIRVIAASNKDLKQAVESHEFREDLFYRIHVVTLKLPALRELGHDIIIIADHFIKIFAYDFKKKARGLTEKAKAKLLSHPWRGNVRELRNVIERAVIFADRDRIDQDDLILGEEKQTQQSTDQIHIHIPEKGLSLFDVEKNLLLEALSKAKGNQSRAARLLGLSLDTFRYRMKKYDISV
ncbi:sigma 54-interacting transcriptional regulator [candidate division KSB1 bacterium]|nr:sigma 54-interacting transcriptional regulator [candidate division KSB1 bacterium]